MGRESQYHVSLVSVFFCTTDVIDVTILSIWNTRKAAERFALDYLSAHSKARREVSLEETAYSVQR